MKIERASERERDLNLSCRASWPDKRVRQVTLHGSLAPPSACDSPSALQIKQHPPTGLYRIALLVAATERKRVARAKQKKRSQCKWLSTVHFRRANLAQTSVFAETNLTTFYWPLVRKASSVVRRAVCFICSPNVDRRLQFSISFRRHCRLAGKGAQRKPECVRTQASADDARSLTAPQALNTRSSLFPRDFSMEEPKNAPQRQSRHNALDTGGRKLRKSTHTAHLGAQIPHHLGPALFRAGCLTN